MQFSDKKKKKYFYHFRTNPFTWASSIPKPKVSENSLNDSQAITEILTACIIEENFVI